MINRKILQATSKDELLEIIKDLDWKNTELEQKLNKQFEDESLSTMGIISSGIAGELYSPVHHLKVNLDFIENNLEHNSPVTSHINSMKSEIDQIQHISEQLSNLTNHDNGMAEDIDIIKLLDSRPINNLLTWIQNKIHSIVLNLPDHPILIRANRKRITEVLILLISNAEDAMINGNEILTISVNSIEKDGSNLAIIEINDTGIGIPEENINQIFNPFFTTKGKSASGLSLMIIYSIINSLGGSIGLKSEVGKGTTFKILLPAL